MKRTARLLLIGFMMVFAACQPETPHVETAHDAEATDHDAAHAADSADHDALPLRPIMQQLGANMTAFTQAMWVEDYVQMAAYAAEIAEHPHIAPDEMARIQATLGSEMDGFVAADEGVHYAAVRLHAAVEARDMDTILRHLGEMQTGCMSCHTRFRERLRTDQPVP